MNLPTIPIERVIVKNRARKDFGNLGALSDSIRRFGLLEPIIVEEAEDGKMLLIAGERRLRASLAAELKQLPYVLKTRLTPKMRKELELEENLHRKDFSWAEEAELKLQIDEISRERLGHAVPGGKNKEEWSLEKLSDKLDESIATTSRDLKLAKYLRKNPEKKAELSKLPKTVALRKIVREEEVTQLKKRKISNGETKELILGDAIELMKKIPQDTIDLILTDPPYGTSAVGGDSGKLTGQGETDNLEHSVEDLLWNFIREAHRILKPGRHIYMFFALEYYNFISSKLDREGFSLNRYPIIWFKGSAMTPFTGMNWSRSWEPFMFAIKPGEKDKMLHLTQPCIDQVSFKPIPPLQRRHIFEKPQDLLEYLIKQSSSENETVLDPFAGSGSTLLAAKALHRNPLGFELDPENYEIAKERLENPCPITP